MAVELHPQVISLCSYVVVNIAVSHDYVQKPLCVSLIGSRNCTFYQCPITSTTLGLGTLGARRVKI